MPITFLDYPNSIDTLATGINDLGEIVGTYQLPDFSTGVFLYTPGAAQPYSTLAGLPSNAEDVRINDEGEIVGQYLVSDGDAPAWHIFLYTPGAGYTTLDPYGVDPTGTYQIGAINNEGQFVGTFTDAAQPDGLPRGFIYTPGAGFTDFEVPGATSTFVNGINDLGQIVGSYQGDSTADSGGFLYSPGAAQPFQFFNSLGVGIDPTAINNDGQIVGWWNDGQFIYTPSSTQPWNLLSTGYDQVYLAINNIGQVVGQAGAQGLVFPTRGIFTSEADTVDFNNLTTLQQELIQANPSAIYDGLGGNDVVVLPDKGNYNEGIDQTSALGWSANAGFVAQDTAGQSYTITGGNGDDRISLGSGNDLVFGSPGNDLIGKGSSGTLTLDYVDGKFADFSGFADGTNQQISGGHLSFVSQASSQNLILLPGSASDYDVSVQFTNNLDFWVPTQTVITTNSDSGLPSITLATRTVERVAFSEQLDNNINLSDGSVAVEMATLANEVYNPSQGQVVNDPLAYQQSGSTVATDTLSNPAQARNWHAVSAMELGIAPADFDPQGTEQYSFVNGVYQAQSTTFSLLFTYAQADAMVLSGVVDDKETLAIVFRGTDQYADYLDYPDFNDYYEQYSPLVEAIKSYLASSAVDIQQVLISGHSLGGAAAQYLTADLTADREIAAKKINIADYALASPGAENGVPSAQYLPIDNFVQVGDPVALVGNNDTPLLDYLEQTYPVVDWATDWASIEPKARLGTDIIIDDGGPTTFSLSQIPYALTWHNANLYLSAIQTLQQFASDANSPFAYSQVGQSLANDTLYTGNSVASNPFAFGAIDGSQIAVTEVSDPTLPNPVRGNAVSVRPGDNYVLGGIGDTVYWDLPASGESVHVVDGGEGSVIFLGTSAQYAFVQADQTNGAVTLPLTEVFYFPGGKPFASDPTSGQLIADLYRVSQISFLDGSVACYCAGTLIETDRGEQKVEALRIGDRVVTASGALRPIKWMGRRSYGGRFIMGRKDMLPICIKSGALADNVPKRDLRISPHHAMYLDGVLVEARDLVNGVSIVQDERVEQVQYFHVELESHDLIRAEGAWSETFIDDDSRGMFHNAHEFATLYPDEMTRTACYCAPRCEAGFEVETIRKRLALRTGLTSPLLRSESGALRGAVDIVNAQAIEGWAQSVDHPDAPVCLDIYQDGRLIGQTLANLYREDLAEAGIGSGRHAFVLAAPDGVTLVPETIEIRRSLDGASLPWSSIAQRRLSLSAT